MNDQTVKLLEQLAAKLGTTSEYLWGVLLKQAPIDSVIGLLQVGLLIFTGWLLYRLHKKFSCPVNEGRSSHYDRYDALAPVMCIGTIIWFVLSGVMLVCIGSIFTGFINPEYWALDYILKTISRQ